MLRLLPFMRWLPGIDRRCARADLLAGLTGAVIVLPQCVAFAALAGMPIEYGLYCAMVPAVVAALFGSSWHLVSGPTNAISIVLFASLAPLEYTPLLWGLALGFVIWGEIPAWTTLTGAVIVICAGLYNLHRERVRRAQERAERGAAA